MHSILNSVVNGQWSISFGKKFIFESHGADSKQKTEKQSGLIIHPEAHWKMLRVGSQFLILSNEINLQC